MTSKPKERRRKQKQEHDLHDDGGPVDDALRHRLAAYGERFLAMFDDRPAPKRARRPALQQAAGLARPFSSSQDVQPPISHSGRAESDTSDCDDVGSDRTGASNSDADDQQHDAADRVIEYIFDRRTVVSDAASGRLCRPDQQQAAPKAAASGEAAAAHPALKQERKRFMSSKAAVVASSGQMAQQQHGGRRKKYTPAAHAEEGEVSRAEFLQMQREVHLLGASALDKQSKKRFEADMLAQLGAKAATGPRISAKIGLGMAKRQAQRQVRALEEAIATGMIKQKGMGKKKRREKVAGLDRGLNEDRGAFKSGIMRVNPLKSR